MAEVLYTPHFKRDAKRLSVSLRKLVEDRLKRFKDDPFDPTLKTHKLDGKLRGHWSFSIDHKIRVIFTIEDKAVFVLHAIGDQEGRHPLGRRQLGLHGAKAAEARPELCVLCQSLLS